MLRHHVAIKELTPYSGIPSNLYKTEYLEREFSGLNNLTIISGNGWMYKDKPRMACYKHRNITHLLNGIGNFDDDNILILDTGKIYRYILPNY